MPFSCIPFPRFVASACPDEAPLIGAVPAWRATVVLAASVNVFRTFLSDPGMPERFCREHLAKAGENPAGGGVLVTIDQPLIRACLECNPADRGPSP